MLQLNIKNSKSKDSAVSKTFDSSSFENIVQAAENFPPCQKNFTCFNEIFFGGFMVVVVVVVIVVVVDQKWSLSKSDVEVEI